MPTELAKPYDFQLDIKRPLNYPSIKYVQGDTDVYPLTITLTNDGKKMDLTGRTVTITFKKPDKNKVEEQCEIVDATNGKIKYQLGTQEIAVSGNVLATVQIFEGVKRLTSTQFDFWVNEQLDDGTAVASSTEYPIITQLISDCNAIKDEEVLRVAAETSRGDNEATRESQESTREGNETTREGNETQRKADETQRKANENIRIAGYQKMIQDSYIIPKAPVAIYDDIVTTYPSPENGWTTRAIDTGKLYRYNSDTLVWEWIDTITNSAYDVLVNEYLKAQYSDWIEEYRSIFSSPDYSEKGLVCDAVIKGRSLFNHNDDTKWTLKTGITLDNGVFTFTGDGIFQRITIPHSFKPLTDYTIIFDVTFSQLNDSNNYHIGTSQVTDSSQYFGTEFDTLGEKRIKFTTKADLSLSPNLDLIKNSPLETGEEIKFKIKAIIEGDYTTGDLANVEINKMSFGANSTLPDIRIQCIGKNKWTLGDIDTTGIAYGDEGCFIGYIPIVANKDFTISAGMGEGDSNSRLRLFAIANKIDNITYELANSQKTLELGLLDRPRSGNVGNANYFVVFAYMQGAGTLYKDIQLEEGLTKTEYQSYDKEYSQAQITGTEDYKSVNETYDEVNVVQGTYTKKNNPYTLTGDDVIATDSVAFTNVQYVTLLLPSDCRTDDTLNMGIDRYVSVDGYNEIDASSRDNVSSIGTSFFFFNDDGRIQFYFPLNTFTTLQDAKNWFDANPHACTYQYLQSKVYYSGDGSGFEVTGKLENFGPGTQYIIEPYYNRDFIYNTGITFDYAITGIDEIKKVVGAELVDVDKADITFASDMKSITIAGALLNDVLHIKAPIDPAEHAGQKIQYKIGMNAAAQRDGNTKGVSDNNKLISDFMIKQNALNISFDHRLVLGGL